MRKMLAVTTAAAALMFAAGPSFAQDTTSNTGAATNEMGSMYVTGEGENMMVMGGDNAEGARVLRGENFAEPEDCPEGSYYMSAENQITACGEGGASFDVTTESMEGMPQGAMALRPRESGEQKQSDSGADGDDGDQGDDESGNQGEGNTQSEGGGDADEGGNSGGGCGGSGGGG